MKATLPNLTDDAKKIGIVHAGLIKVASPQFNADVERVYIVVDPRDFNEEEVYKASVAFGFWVVHRYIKENDEKTTIEPGGIISGNDGPDDSPFRLEDGIATCLLP